MEPALSTEYKERIVPALKESLKLDNIHDIPKLVKVVVNSSIGSADDRSTALEEVVAEMALITGQKPAQTVAKKSVSNFKLREGNIIGAKVTLRGRRMYEFLERFIKTAIPRIRDFRGVSPKSFDGHGNYTIGVSDQTIFPEVELDKVKRALGFDITIVTTARTDTQAKELIRELGMPFRDATKAA